MLRDQSTFDEASSRLSCQIMVEDAYEGLTLTVRWDDEASPAIALPLVELFAAGLEAPTTSSSVLGARIEGGDAILRLRLPMPFATRAEWSVDDASGRPIDLGVALFGRPGVPDGVWGHLHADRSETLAADGRDRHPVLSADGAGRLVGLCMMLEGYGVERLGGLSYDGRNFLEGDELVIVDGRELRGTGTEDIPNSSFYFDEGAMGTPFAQAWGIHEDESAMPATGSVSACRWYVLTDAIDYQSELRYDLEVGPNEPASLSRYRTVAFHYRL